MCASCFLTANDPVCVCVFLCVCVCVLGGMGFLLKVLMTVTLFSKVSLIKLGHYIAPCQR